MKELLSENGKTSLMRLAVLITLILSVMAVIACFIYGIVYKQLVDLTGLILGCFGASGIGELAKALQKKHEAKE